MLCPISDYRECFAKFHEGAAPVSKVMIDESTQTEAAVKVTVCEAVRRSPRKRKQTTASSSTTRKKRRL